MPPSPEELRDELTAYLDGELDERAVADFEERLRTDPALRREAETLKRTWDLLDFLPQPEPSPTFTSKTVDKLAVLRPASTPSSSVMRMRRAARAPSPWPTRFAVALAALVLFLLGYAASGPVFRKGPPRLDSEETEKQMARDLRILDQFTLFQLGEDIEFVAGLDQPDLFGE